MSHCKTCNSRCNFFVREDTVGRIIEDSDIRQIQFKKDETIIKQNTFVTSVFYIVDGWVKLVLEADNKKNLIVRILGSGSYLGLSSLWSNEIYPYSITALKTTSICMLRVEKAREICESHADCKKFVIDAIIDENIFNYRKLTTIGTRQMYGRLAETLLELAELNHNNEPIYHNISRKDLAELSGMSVESMNRILNELKSDKLIDIKGKEIMVSDKELLQRLSRVG